MALAYRYQSPVDTKVQSRCRAVALTRVGGLFQKVPNWKPLAIIDGRLVTGQNPASSTAGAKALLRVFGRPAASWTTIEVSRED